MRQFSKLAVPFCNLLRTSDAFSFFISLSVLANIFYFIITHLNRYKWLPDCDEVHFSSVKWCWESFLSLLTICLSSWRNVCLDGLPAIELPYYYFKSSFYTLNTSPFLVKHNQASVLIMYNLLFFFITCDFSIISKILPNRRSQKFNFVFSSKSFILLAYSFRSKTYFELIFCVWYEEYTQCHFFQCEYPVVMAPFL